MSDYSSLKATINANIKANNNHEITGAITNSVLNAMVDSLGAGYQFIGVATPTNPGSAQTPDYKCFYLATTPGTYTNLGGLVVADGEVAILKYDSSWTKEVTGIATAAQINQLYQELYEKINVLETPQYTNGFFYNGTNRGSGANWQCAIIPIDGVTHLLVKTNMYGDSANCCITDASDNVLASWKQADLVNNLIDVDLSQYPGASKLYISVYQYGGFVYGDAFVYGAKPVASKDEVEKIEEEIVDINAEISGVTPIDSGELVAGLVTTGSAPNFISGGTYRTTDFLPVTPGDKIVAKCAVGTSGYAITCYSSNTQSSYVAGAGVVGVDSSTLNDYEITIPVGVNYIRVTTEGGIAGFDGTIPITKYSDDGIIPRLEIIEGEIYGQTISLNNPVLINTRGAEQTSGGNNYWSSDFIKVTPGQSLKIDSLTGWSGALIVSFYTNNEQSSFAGHGLVGDGTLNKIVDQIVPNGVSYMRLCSGTGETGPLSVFVSLNKDGERLLSLENTEHKTILSFKRTSPRLPMVLFQMDMASAAYNPTILDYMNILSANGIKKSTYNVLPQYMGADAYKNFDIWMNEIYSKGNEVALHTDQSYVFNEGSSLTPEQIQAAMVDYLTRMKAKGYDVTGFIPLGANLKPSFKHIVRQFCSWMLSGTNADPADVNPLEPNVMDFICGLSTSPYAIKRVSLESMDTEYTPEKDAEILQVAKDVVDATIANGGYVIFYAHTYNTTFGTTYTLRPGVLEPLCQYIKQKIDNMEIVTGNTNEMLEWYYTPRVGE